MERGLKYYALICFVLFLVACQEAPLNPPANPQRIVSLKPNLTEMLFAIGAGDRVVGVTQHCQWPEAAQALPKIGGYAAPDFEKILSLKSDLVVTNKESSNPRFIALLEKAGIATLVLETRSLAQIHQTIEKLGVGLNVTDAAQELNQDIQNRLKKVQAQSHGRPAKRSLLVIQRHPLIVVGPKSFINEVLSAAGAQNVVESASAYPRVSMEEVLAWRPEVIIDVDPASKLSTWTDYTTLPAVQQNQIYFLSPNMFRPGPRIAQTAQMIANALQ